MQHQNGLGTVAATSGKRTDYIQWDDYFMATALLSAKRSKDPVTQVGACIVDSEKRIVAIGYNGFPRNCSDDTFPWRKITQNGNANGDENHADDPLNEKYMYVVHAEANAILNRNSTNLKNTRLYTTLFPCNECAKLIVQSGISEVLYISDKYADKPKFRASKRMFDAAGVIYRQYIPTQRQIVLDFDGIIENEKNVSLNQGLNELKLEDKV